jgi:thiosulfate/3-mercaptopyruvate sulfurtransferase
MKFLKSFEWLLNKIDDPNVRIIDCRFQLNEKEEGPKRYKESHIPNAVYMNLEEDLSGSLEKHGGRHPLPDLQALSNKLSTIGIDHHVEVICYDDQNGAMASRLWWLLQYLGHTKSYVLNGTFSLWKQKGNRVESKIPSFLNREFVPHINNELFASVTDVKNSLNKQGSILIDSREAKRYLGIEEPIDREAGHIPGALNSFWMEGIDANGIWKNVKSQQQRFSNVPKDREIIVYCGSGVTACPNVLALKEAGYERVKLYIGSWSDWISYPDNPIE